MMKAFIKPKFVSSLSKSWKYIFASLFTKITSGILDWGNLNCSCVKTDKYALLISNLVAFETLSDIN